jgi:hypothetical protein
MRNSLGNFPFAMTIFNQRDYPIARSNMVPPPFFYRSKISSRHQTVWAAAGSHGQGWGGRFWQVYEVSQSAAKSSSTSKKFYQTVAM